MGSAISAGNVKARRVQYAFQLQEAHTRNSDSREDSVGAIVKAANGSATRWKGFCNRNSSPATQLVPAEVMALALPGTSTAREQANRADCRLKEW